MFIFDKAFNFTRGSKYKKNVQAKEKKPLN